MQPTGIVGKGACTAERKTEKGRLNLMLVWCAVNQMTKKYNCLPGQKEDVKHFPNTMLDKHTDFPRNIRRAASNASSCAQWRDSSKYTVLSRKIKP